MKNRKTLFELVFERRIKTIEAGGESRATTEEQQKYDVDRENELMHLRDKNKDLELMCINLKSQQDELSMAKEELEAEKRALEETLERRSLEMSFQRDELMFLQNRLHVADTEKVLLKVLVTFMQQQLERATKFLQTKITSLTADLKDREDVTLGLQAILDVKEQEFAEQHRRDLKCCRKWRIRLKEEKQLLQNHITSLTSDLQQKHEEIVNLQSCINNREQEANMTARTEQQEREIVKLQTALKSEMEEKTVLAHTLHMLQIDAKKQLDSYAFVYQRNMSGAYYELHKLCDHLKAAQTHNMSIARSHSSPLPHSTLVSTCTTTHAE